MTTPNESTQKFLYAPERLMNLLREQASLYGQLETLAQRQRTLISADDTGPLLSILTQRRKLSVRLGTLATGLEPIRRNWSEIRERLTPDLKTEAQGLWDDTKQSLRRLMEGDEQDARLLSARKESIRRELQATHSTTHALAAYKNRTDDVYNARRLDEAS